MHYSCKAITTIELCWLNGLIHHNREFKAELKLSGIDTIGLVNDVTKVISDNLHINMKSVHFDR